MLKRILPLAVIFLSLALSAMPAEQSEWPKIKEAITNGNAQKLFEFFAPSVTLSLPNHKGNFSCKQAKLMMKDFFNDNPPSAFTVKNSGPSGRSSEFYLGTYTSSNKMSFAIYLLLENNQGKQTITQISIERN